MKKTTIKVVVLSEDEIHERMDTMSILHECDTGDYVLFSTTRLSEDVTDEEMARLLWEAGSDPGFFQLDDIEVSL